MIIKRLILIMLLLCCSMALLQAQIPGDVTGDGTVNIVDALTLLQYMIGLQPYINPGAADLNNDGKVSFADVLILDHMISIGRTLTPGPSDNSPGVGTISLKTEPYSPYLPEQNCFVKVFLNTGTQIFAAVDLTINYDETVLEYLATELPSNLINMVRNETGSIQLRGFNTNRAKPSGELHLATLKFKVLSPGAVNHEWQIKIDESIDRTTANIGTPAAAPLTSRIIDGLFGDVDLNQVSDIIDALKIARHYVGLSPLSCESRVADVNNNERIEILDALMVAQKYVGLIAKFPVEEYTPEPIADL